MRKKWFFVGILGLLLVFGLTLCGCPNPTDETPEQPGIPETPGPVDSAFWFGDLHDELIGRVGTVTSEEYTGDMGQIANCQYVCDAINIKWGTDFIPVSGTATQAANCEYLLKMIDEANSSTTSFGTGSYATKQVIDKTAVDKAVGTLWVPGGKFVAVAYNTNTAAYSADGINWTATTMPSSANWHSVAYGNGKFVAVAYGTNNAAYSSNGVSWTAATMPSNSSWHNVAYGNGKFVAVANSDKAAYSADGISWTAATMPSSAGWYSVTYGGE